MPDHLTPGVYVEELPGPRTIQPAETSVTALVGPARSGPVGQAVRATSAEQVADAFGARSWLGRAAADYFGNGGQVALVVRSTDRATSLTALAAADPFQLLVRHPKALGRAAAHRLAVERRAFLVVDSPDGSLPAGLGHNAAAYHPRLVDAEGRARACAPAVAGIYARTDQARGVWKSPAGTEADLRGVAGLETVLDDGDVNLLATAQVNALRVWREGGPVVWGARTASDDPEWRYVAVRRTALFLENSLVDGLGWVVFEPNAEPLWAQVRGSVEAFLNGLWRQGAFPGAKADEAYFVRCDGSTMTQADLDAGRLVVLVGFAALKPAEFVILRLEIRTATP